MKTIGVRALRDNPGILSQCATVGEYLLLTNRNHPISLSVPFNDELIKGGVLLCMAIRLYEDNVLTLVKAAALAGLSTEAFLSKLAVAGVVVLDQSPEDLASDLSMLDD